MKQRDNNGAAALYGLVGFPLGHSFSAKYFADKFAKENIDAAYRNFEIDNIARLPEEIAAHPNLRGLNVTIPYKRQVMSLLDNVDPVAESIGAVNVICVRHTTTGTRLEGHNADVAGFTESLRPLLRPCHTDALVLGTGGASKAVVYGLRQLGITPQYVSRQSGRDSIGYEEITEEAMRRHKLVVNCTPLGMFPNTETAPGIPYGLLTPEHLLYDLVYNPEETLFLKKGRERGAATKNGLEMLHLQAEASWRFWNAGGGM